MMRSLRDFKERKLSAVYVHVYHWGSSNVIYRGGNWEGKGQILTASFKSLELVCGEGDGTPLQYSCLENPMDGGAW